MSCWTEILLTARALEDIAESGSEANYVAIDYINAWLRDADRRYSQLFLIAPPNEDQHGPHSCFAGHVKSLDRSGFIAIVRRAPWQWLGLVQLFLREEDDEGFREVRLWNSYKKEE